MEAYDVCGRTKWRTSPIFFFFLLLFIVPLQRGGAPVEGGVNRGVRGGQAGGADPALPAEGTGDDGGKRGLAEEGGGPAGTGKRHGKTALCATMALPSLSMTYTIFLNHLSEFDS